MSVRDFPQRPSGPADSLQVQQWLDLIQQRLCLDDQIELTSLAAGDEFYVFDVSASALRKITATNVAAFSSLVSDVYTPTRSAESNLDSNVTMSEAQYMRVGNTVTVSGRFTADPTAGGAASFEFTLPIASNIGAVEDLAGVAFAGGIAGQGAAISGSVANNTAVVSWIAVDTTSQAWSYTLTYQVI